MKELKEFGKRSVALGAVLLMLVSAFAFIGGAHGATVYSLTWEEKNLPSGTSWGVIIWNETGKTATTLTNVSFTPPGSTHVFGNITFSAESGVTYLYNYTGTPWYFNSSRNSVTVSSAGSYEVNFDENFTLNVTERGWIDGLPSGDTFQSGWSMYSNAWEISINNVTHSSTSTNQEFKFANGTRVNIKYPSFGQLYKYNNSILPGLEFRPAASNTSITSLSNQSMTVSYNIYAPLIISGGLNRSGINYVPYNRMATINMSATTLFYVYNMTAKQTMLNASISPYITMTNISVNHFTIGINTTVPIIMEPYIYIPDLTYSAGSSYTSGFITHFSDIFNIPQFLVNSYLSALMFSTKTSSTNLTHVASLLILNSTTVVTGLNAPPRTVYTTHINLTGLLMPSLHLHLKFPFGYINTTIGYNMMPYDTRFINVSGYVKPYNATIILPLIDRNSSLSSLLHNTNNGSFSFQAFNNSYFMAYAQGYAPRIIHVKPQIGLNMKENITLTKINTTAIPANAYSYNVSTGGYIDLSGIPLNSTVLLGNSSIDFEKLSQNEFYIIATTSAEWNTAPINITIPTIQGHRYKVLITSNALNPNITYNFTAPSNIYNLTYSNWELDPYISVEPYPVAVISAPTAVAYDSAVVLSGSGSYSNITNYTWHIRGPQNFTEYGKTPSVFFSLPGSYSVSLTVTNAAGLTNTSSTSLSVVSSSQDTKIIISAVKSTLGNGTVEYAITVTAKDNVSISSVTVMVGKAYVNVTLTKQTGYEYYYTLYLLPSKYAYGNYTVKITAWNSLDRYNSLTTYLTFGSISQGGLFDYIISHSVLAIMFGIVVVLLIILIFVGEEHFEALHGKNGKKKRGGEKGGKKR